MAFYTPVAPGDTILASDPNNLSKDTIELGPGGHDHDGVGSHLLANESIKIDMLGDDASYKNPQQRLVLYFPADAIATGGAADITPNAIVQTTGSGVSIGMQLTLPQNSILIEVTLRGSGIAVEPTIARLSNGIIEGVEFLTSNQTFPFTFNGATSASINNLPLTIDYSASFSYLLGVGLQNNNDFWSQTLITYTIVEPKP